MKILKIEIDGKKGAKIITILKEEKQSLKEIYDNIQELIIKMFETISGELDEKEKKALQVLKNCKKNRNVKWSYNEKILTSKELVHYITKNNYKRDKVLKCCQNLKCILHQW